MRKLLISLLLAGAAATPALADPGDHHNHDNNNARAERQQARSERQSSSNHQSNGQARFNGNGGGQAGQQNFSRSNGFQQNGQVDPAQAQAFRAERERMLAAQNGGGDSQGDRRNFRRNRQSFNGQQQVTDESLRQSDRPLPGVMRSRDRSQMVRDIPRRGTQPPLIADNNHRRDRISWNRDWRHDGRYDWRDWRHRHRSIFHLGFYFDPFGWGYQPFDIGWRLWPNYYSSNYWINDPYDYRLPYAPPGTRWIRYYNDALLVDMYTGEVVDAIRDFFW
jgi:Nickel/cobalt transporter regulator